MIASLRGPVADIGLDTCVVEAGGLGYRVHATPNTLADLRTGSEVTLATSLVVREDSMRLYGFGSEDERDVFEKVQTVSGVGPRLALAMLAVHSPDALRAALAAEDVKALTKVPGVGDKGARRIIVELGDRLGAPAAASPAPDPHPGGQARIGGDVVEALVGLGWPAKTAEKVVEQVYTDEAELDTASALRAALQHLGGARHG